MKDWTFYLLMLLLGFYVGQIMLNYHLLGSIKQLKQEVQALKAKP